MKMRMPARQFLRRLGSAKDNMKLVEKYKKIPLQARASIWYTVCNVLQKGISFLIIPIYIRLLSTAEYGQYTVFQSWRDILIIFTTLNLYCGVFTKAMVDYEDDRDRYTSCMQGLSTVITIGMLFVYMINRTYLNRFLEMDTITMLLLFAYYVFFPAFSFWSVRQRVECKYIRMVVATLLVSVFTPGLSLILLFQTDLREKAVIWGYLIVQCAVGLFFYVYQYFRGKCFYEKDYWIRALSFNIPLIPHYLSLIILGQTDRIMIQKYCGNEKAGIYSLAYQVSVAMNVLLSAIDNAKVPWTYERLKKQEYKPIQRVTNMLCGLMIFITIGVILLAPEVITLLGTEDYKEAIWIIPAVSVSVYFTFCYKLFSTVEFYYGATKFVMIASSIGALLNIILNAIFIPRYGFIAAGYTTLVCYLVFMVMHSFRPSEI